MSVRRIARRVASMKRPRNACMGAVAVRTLATKVFSLLSQPFPFPCRCRPPACPLHPAVPVVFLVECGGYPAGVLACTLRGARRVAWRRQCSPAPVTASSLATKERSGRAAT